MNAWLFIIPVVIYFVGGLMAAHRIRAARFAHRKDIPFDEIYNEYFQGTNISMSDAEALWIEAAKALRILPGKLRPSDSFDKELTYCLSWFPFVDLNDDFWHIGIKRLKKRNFDSAVAKDMKTLGDYIVRLASVANR